ncbi:MAG: tetratricopeptide repeat protein, partial [Alkalinema sp. RL_2_19]|nr:tetratricopeptide repeat protein [Alkalinema sp. RL_2_19]
LSPDDARAYALLGATYNSLKQERSAIPVLQKALKLGSKSTGTYLDLGVAYYNTKQFAEAATYYQLVTQKAPKFATGYAYLGDAYLRSGQAAKAIDAYEAALRIDPNNRIAKQGITRARAKTL